MKILFATGNEGKMREIRAIMENSGFEVISSKEAGFDMDVDENGTTFEENAVIKAKAVAEASGMLTLADDSGLEIDFFDKEPGIYSARWLGHDTSYDVKNAYVLEHMLGVPDEKRTARYVCSIAAVWPDGRTRVVTETMEGMIARESRGNGGFGYDPIFLVPEYNMTNGELDAEKKNEISHRGKAMRAMRKLLSETENI